MTVESNVIYGMVSGLALLLDVHYPEQSNRRGILHISGSGWSAPLGFDARPLKESTHVEIEARPLVEAGYTVFTINHRASPRFHYPAAVEDAQRAVRFVRYHADRFGIDANRIGAIGGSSGGHLVSLLGLLDGDGDPADESSINRVSAKVHCVVARAVPSSFVKEIHTRPGPSLFLGMSLSLEANPTSIEYRRAWSASPIAHVTPEASPFLLIHGDADDVVPVSQSDELAQALRQAGVPVHQVRIPGGGHGPGLLASPDVQARVRAWFDEHLL